MRGADVTDGTQEHDSRLLDEWHAGLWVDARLTADETEAIRRRVINGLSLGPALSAVSAFGRRVSGSMSATMGAGQAREAERRTAS
jgi:hypothetical protein